MGARGIRLAIWRRWLSDNQDCSVAQCAALNGGQLEMKEEVTGGERSASGCESQEVGARKRGWPGTKSQKKLNCESEAQKSQGR